MNLLKDIATRIKIRILFYGDRFESNMLNHSPIAKELMPIFGIYLMMLGVVNWVANHWMLYAAKQLLPHWMPGLATTQPSYNASFINYVMLVMCIVGGWVLAISLQYLPDTQRFLSAKLKKIAIPLLIISALATLAVGIFAARFYFAFATLAFFPQLLNFMRQATNKNHSLKKQRYAKNAPLLLWIPVLVSFSMAAYAWYPVQIPNDYLEVPDAVHLLNQPVADRMAVIDCLEMQKYKTQAIRDGFTTERMQANEIAARMGIVNLKNATPKEMAFIQAITKFTRIASEPLPPCRLDISPTELYDLKEPLIKTGDWQSGPGRLFYHHSFIFVPALHVLKYGIASPTPYMYGLGNTLFHAALMKLTSESLTGYFDTYPLAQLTGILAMGLLVLYITRSFLAFPVSVALMTAMLCQLGFEFVLLPPGFSPLRYLGLLLQVATIFWTLRGTQTYRPLLLLIAAGVSLLWNTEFAFIGLVGQALVLFTPQLPYSFVRRIGWVAVMGLITIVCLLALDYLMRGYMQTMYLALFGLFPVLPAYALWPFCLILAIGFAILGWRAMYFTGAERAARLCTLPILALVIMKFIFYPWMVHFYYTLVLIAPLALIYVNWAPKVRDGEDPQHALIVPFATLLVLLGLFQSLSYLVDAKHFHRLTMNSFVTNQWTELGERFTTVIPAQPIVSRMMAVRAEIKPEDTVIFLSPFDQLMSFYANPERYCGHFELNLNPLTEQLVDSVVSCVRSTPHALVVYDTALDTACPDGVHADYYNMKACGITQMVRQGGHSIFLQLQPHLILVKKVGPLSFYRRTEDVPH